MPKPKLCIECSHFRKGNVYGRCQKYDWNINMALAKTQCLCDFEWHHRMPDGKPIHTNVTPHVLLLEKRGKKHDVV